MFLSNRSLQLKMVKDDSAPNSSADKILLDHEDVELISAAVKDHVEHIAMAVVAVLGTRKVINTISEVIIIAAKAKF